MSAAWSSTSASSALSASLSGPASRYTSEPTTPPHYSSRGTFLQIVHRTRVSSSLRRFEGKFRNARGQALFYFSLFPPVDRPLRGVVLFLHGQGDHCRRFPFLFERLCKDGFGVITYDFVNHGASDCDSYRTRAHVHSYKHLVNDTNDFLSFAKRVIYPQAKLLLAMSSPGDTSTESSSATWEPPLIITGISFGTLIGMHTVLSCRHKFHAAFWSGPVLDVQRSPVLTLLATIIHPLSWVVPRSRLIKGVDYKLLCRDPGFMEDFEADPLASSDALTLRSVQQILSAIMQLRRDKRVQESNSAFCRVPMLFLAGSEDRIADQSETRRFVDRLGNSDKELKILDGVFHCVYEDPEREDVLKYLEHWLLVRCPQHEVAMCRGNSSG